MDTGVGEQTRTPEASPVAQNFVGPQKDEISVAPKLVGFAAGSRFVVFENGDHAIVVDTSLPENAPHHVFDIDGRPLTTTESSLYDRWMQAGLSSAHLPQGLVVSDKGTLLVKTVDGAVEAVDLLNRGALVAKVRMENGEGVKDLRGASISPDGTMFGIWTSSTLQLVRTEDEDTATYVLHRDPRAGDDFKVHWNASGDVVMWSDAKEAHVVSRSSFDAELRIDSMPSPKIDVSKDGKTFVISSSPVIEAPSINRATTPPGVVEVWRLGEDKPQAHIASAFVGHTLVSDDGRRVAWTEYSGDPTKTMHLHTLDIETGVHARFASVGECGHYEEQLVAFEGDTLKTDAECSPGCPSFSHQANFISYDFASGRVIKKWLGEQHAPYNDTLSSQINTVEDLAKKLHFERSDGQAPLVHHPKKSSALFVDAQKDITLITESGGHTIAKLEDSTGFHASDVHFSPDGTRIVGVSDEGYIAIWRTEDGHRIWSRR